MNPMLVFSPAPPAPYGEKTQHHPRPRIPALTVPCPLGTLRHMRNTLNMQDFLIPMVVEQTGRGERGYDI
jgi:hypothetical protein